MNERTTVILIDALGYAFAERSGFEPPGLPNKARLRTVLGFSQAAITTILTGLEPDEHGLWMMYSFARGGSPFAWLRMLPASISARRLWLIRLIHVHLRRFARVRGYYSLYDVPREVLPYLDIPARGSIFAPGGAGEVATVLDELERAQRSALVWDYNTPEPRAFQELEGAVGAGRGSFHLLYAAGLDSDLHSYGTSDSRVAARLEWYRDRIASIVSAARGTGGRRIIVLGDHGMCDVRARIDVKRRVDTLGLRIPRDYVPFYDSTMARFRVFSKDAMAALRELLRSEPMGHCLDSLEIEALGVSFPDGRFGDLIFLADPGVVLSPSYMGEGDVAAMHGYHPDADDMSSVLFSNVDLPGSELSLGDVAPLLVPGFEPGRRGGSR